MLAGTGKSAGEHAIANPPKCPLRAVACPMYVLCSRLGRLQQSQDGARSFEIASPPDLFAALGLCSVCMKKRHRPQIGEDSPKASLRLDVREFSVWAVSSGREITKATLPMSRAADLVRYDRFFSPRDRSTPAGRKRSRLCRNSNVAQLFGPSGSPFFLSGDIPPRTVRGHSLIVAVRPEVSLKFVVFPYGRSTPPER